MALTRDFKETISERLTKEYYSPYKLAKVESALRNKKIPPQKLYGYVSAGRISSSTNELDKIQISRDEAIRYLVTQVIKEEN